MVILSKGVKYQTLQWVSEWEGEIAPATVYLQQTFLPQPMSRTWIFTAIQFFSIFKVKQDKNFHDHWFHIQTYPISGKQTFRGPPTRMQTLKSERKKYKKQWNAQGSIERMIDDPFYREDVCESKVEIVTPYWASNSNGKVVNIIRFRDISSLTLKPSIIIVRWEQ